MNEKLLQHIWQFQLYHKTQLTTSLDDELLIIHQGNCNTNQGPDFLNAVIKINGIKLIGNIEIHLKTSDFLKHKHEIDTAYQSLILHVVWENDIAIDKHLLNPIPTLELKGRVAKHLLDKYENLMYPSPKITCYNFLPALSNLAWLSFKERLATERLQQKSTVIIQLLKANNNNWEETFWQQLAYNLGLTLNHELFLQTAKIVTHTLLAKNKKSCISIEALLMGTANLLPQTTPNKYVQVLQNEFAFLQKKYQLKSALVKPVFLRMRPANFPTIRMAQLSILIYNSVHLFSKIKEAQHLEQVQAFFKLTANDYWNNHYSFTDDEHNYKPKHLGINTINNIIINTVVPVLYAYGLHTKQEEFCNRVFEWLNQLPPEKNSLINSWKKYQVENKNALQSQALIELTKNYCTPKKCLQCAVGNKVLRG